jgi:hypothetical protein
VTANGSINSAGKTERGVTSIAAPATPEAQQWDGWGTALKPALEPITVARKPFKGTVAANVLEHGTGGINMWMGAGWGLKVPEQRAGQATVTVHSREVKCPWRRRPSELGRWPANLIHDGSDEVVGLFPESKGQQGAISGKEPSGKTNAVYGEYQQRNESEPRNDSGSAARFFYQAPRPARSRPQAKATPIPRSNPPT